MPTVSCNRCPSSFTHSSRKKCAQALQMHTGRVHTKTILTPAGSAHHNHNGNGEQTAKSYTIEKVKGIAKSYTEAYKKKMGRAQHDKRQKLIVQLRAAGEDVHSKMRMSALREIAERINLIGYKPSNRSRSDDHRHERGNAYARNRRNILKNLGISSAKWNGTAQDLAALATKAGRPDLAALALQPTIVLAAEPQPTSAVLVVQPVKKSPPAPVPMVEKPDHDVFNFCPCCGFNLKMARSALRVALKYSPA